MTATDGLGVRLCALLLLASAQCAAADNLLGLYAGAGAGSSNVPVAAEFTNSTYVFDRHDTGWKIFAGIRPVSFVGAEVEYIDFGHSSATAGIPPGAPEYTQLNADASARAPALFGVGYLPLPVPWLDVFGKAGVARVAGRYNSSYFGIVCVTTAPCPLIAYAGSNYVSRTDTAFAYGAGLQLHFGALAARAEYERTGAPYGDPYMISGSLIWTL